MMSPQITQIIQREMCVLCEICPSTALRAVSLSNGVICGLNSHGAMKPSMTELSIACRAMN